MWKGFRRRMRQKVEVKKFTFPGARGLKQARNPFSKSINSYSTRFQFKSPLFIDVSTFSRTLVCFLEENKNVIMRVLITISDQNRRLEAAALLLLILQCSSWLASVTAQPQVPAMFVFGDSLVDVGNNNFLRSMARANYAPYGYDFSSGPTGRFSNGKNLVDLFADFLGLSYPPPFADPDTVGSVILNGVNYASAAAGILDETGQHYGQRFSLSQQVVNFEMTLNQLRSMMSAGNLTQFLAKSIAVLVFGSNDYINNYLLPSLYTSSLTYSPPQFADVLLNHYARQLLALHSVGLRKFMVAGVGPLGCIPNQRATGLAPEGRCLDSVNQVLGTLNEGLRSLVDQLNTNHTGAIFVYANTYGAVGDILNNPATYGFSVVDRGCCGLGRNQGEITCLPCQVPCADRNQFVFWDAFHPTQAATAVLAWRAFRGPPSDSYPINIQQMALL